MPVEIKKSPKDDRDYLYSTVCNDSLRVCTIHDSKGNGDSAAALCVRHAGSYSDPDEFLGLAHLVEHMLFLGTTPHPTTDHFLKYLCAHGGHGNAYTSPDLTCFYFNVNNAFLPQAFEIFASFFVSPLFDCERIDLELKAIDSEHSMHIQNDHHKMMSVLKGGMNSASPCSRFHTGTSHSLNKPTLQQEILRFYHNHYIAKNMTLCVLSPDSHQNMISMITRSFGNLPTGNNIGDNIPAPFPPPVPFQPFNLRKHFHFTTLSNVNSLDLFWPISSYYETKYYLESPFGYPRYMLQLECPGSLSFYLKNKKLIIRSGSTIEKLGTVQNLFILSFELTEEGKTRIEDILTATFAYINMLLDKKVPSWIFREVSEIARIQFDFEPKIPAEILCKCLSKNILYYPIPHILSLGCGEYLFDPTLIRECLSLLANPANFLYLTNEIETSFLSTFKTYEFEPLYQTKIHRSDIDPSLFDRLVKARNDSFLLPKPNPFIPSSFDLRCPSMGYTNNQGGVPIVIKDTPTYTLWHHFDVSFGLPKANVLIKISSPTFHESPLATVCGNLFCLLVQNSLSDCSFFSSLAGLDFHLSLASDGLFVSVCGFNDKLGVLLNMLFQKIRDVYTLEQAFPSLKQTLIKKYDDLQTLSPNSQALLHLNLLLKNRIFSRSCCLFECKQLQFSDLIYYHKRFFSRFHSQILVHGNLLAGESISLITTNIFKVLDSGPLLDLEFESAKQTIIKLPPYPAKNRYVSPNYHSDSAISCTFNYFQIDMDTPRTSVLLDLTKQLVHTRIITQLRHTEQLGYYVLSSSIILESVNAFFVTISSHTHSCEYLDTRIDQCLQDCNEHFQNLSQEEFNEHISVLETRYKKKHSTLEKASNSFWFHIKNGYSEFNFKLLKLESLLHLTKEDFVTFYSTYIKSAHPLKRKKLSIFITNTKSKENIDDPQAIRFDTINQFKNSKPLFPRKIPI